MPFIWSGMKKKDKNTIWTPNSPKLGFWHDFVFVFTGELKSPIKGIQRSLDKGDIWRRMNHMNHQQKMSQEKE